MRPSARLSAFFTPLRLVVFGVVCLSISGMMFATQYHNAEYTQTELRRPQAAVVTRDPRDVRRSLNAQAQSRLARISLYNRNSSSAFDPIIPSNLNRYDLARANKIIHTVCPQINQTLYGPNGEAIPSLRVVAAGMGRSGSTWQFNAIIHILREAGIEPATKHGQLKDFLSLGLTLGCQYSVVKCHQFHPYFLEIADYVITSHRDTRDSYASLVDLKAGFMFDHYWGEYRRWRPFACVDMKYEDFYADQIREIDRLIQTLPVPKSINATRVWELVEGKRLSQQNASRKTPDWDPKSGYFKGHVQDPVPGRWRKLIGTVHTNDLVLIENMTSEWLVAEGYELAFANGSTQNATIPTSPPFPLSPHTPMPYPISASARCPLDRDAKALGRDMPAPTDFNKQLDEWRRRRAPPTTPPPALIDHTHFQHPTVQKRTVPDATPQVGARRGQTGRANRRRP